MANRYWIAGSNGNNVNDPSNWSATSGGAGGASAPTAADNVYFDGNSDAGTAVGGTFSVTVNSALNCKDLIVGDGVTVTALDRTMILINNSGITISGSLFYPVTGMTTQGTSSTTFAATTTGNTITLNGKALGGVVAFNGVGGGWTLGSAFTATGDNTTLTAGTLSTANFNFTSFNIRIRSTNVFNAGSSAITSSVSFEAGTSGGTFNAGTSVITILQPSGSTYNFFGGGGTFYEVRVPDGAFGNGSITITGANTFFNLRIEAHALSASCRTVLLSDNQTITGTFIAKSGVTSFIDRIVFCSTARGTVRTITAAAVSFGNGVDFVDITAAGASAPWNLTGISAGNGGGNTNITFPAPKTVYWNLAGSQNWTADAWATTPTGAPALANFPLAQDTAVVTEAGAAGTIAVSRAATIGSLIFDNGVSPRTSSVTLAHNTSPSPLWIIGDMKLSSGVVFTTTAGGQPFVFTGYGTQNITSANRAFINAIAVDKPVGAELVLQDNMTIPNIQTFTLTRGTINLNNKVLYTGIFASDNANVRSIAFGTSGKIDLIGNARTVMGMSLAGNFTMTGTPSVELSYTGSTGVRRIEFSSRYDPAFNGGGATEANVLNYTITAGADRVVTRNIGMQCSCRDLTFTDNFTGIWGNNAAASEEGLPTVTYGNLRLSPNMTFELTAAGGFLFFSATTGTQQFTSSGKTFPRSVTKNGAGTLRLVDNLTLAAGLAFNHTVGTVDINNKILTAPSYSTSSSSVRSLVFGTGELVLTGVSGVLWDASTSNLLTVIPGSGKIFITDTSAAGKNFNGGGIQTYPEVVIQGGASTSLFTITGANRFEKITNGRTSAYTIVFPNETTTFNSWGLNGTEGNLVSLARTGGTGGFVISYAPSGTMIAQFVSISNSTFLPVGKGYAVKSVNGGGNTGWIFGAPAFGKFLSFFSVD